MSEINLTLQKFFSFDQWVNNFQKHPFVSMFFVILFCYVLYSVYAVGTVLSTFQKNFASYDENYILIKILVTYFFRVSVIILGLIITYSIITENPFKKIHFNMIKIIGLIIIVLPIIIIIVHRVQYDAVNEVNAYIDKASLINPKWNLFIEILDSFNEIILGCFIIILSEVFKKGYILKQENDLTV